MSWIKLPRTVLKSPVFKDPRLLKVWLWCMLKAAHKPTILNMVVRNNDVAVPLRVGQFIFGAQKAANELDIPVTSLRKLLKQLQQMGHIDIEATQYYSILKLNTSYPTEPAPKAKKTEPAIKIPEGIIDFSPEEINQALEDLKGEPLQAMMTELGLYSHPQVILIGYQLHLSKKPQLFQSAAQIKMHLRRYLLREWV